MNQGMWVLALLFFFLITLVVLLLIQIMRLNKRVDSLLGSGNNSNIEGALFDFHREVKEARQIFKAKNTELESLLDFSKRFFCRWSLVHYNAYGDMGGDVSFILCLLNKENNGLLINSIHSRNGTRLYSKEVKGGQCKDTISEEEKDAIEKALNSVS